MIVLYAFIAAMICLGLSYIVERFNIPEGVKWGIITTLIIICVLLTLFLLFWIAMVICFT